MNARDKDVPAEKVLFDATNAMPGGVESARYRTSPSVSRS